VRPLLAVDRINTYYDKSHIIKDVSFDVSSGEVVALVGRNGVGKTTILRSIMGLTPPRSGTIVFNGHPTGGREPFQLARWGMGFVFEERRVFATLSVKDNLQISAVERPSGRRQWTYDRIMDVFPLLKKLADHKAMNLSGGEQQLLAIARALMGNPELLLLDEPSEGLAPLVVRDLADLLREVKKEMTILLAEQNLKFALSFTDRVYIVGKGRIMYEGTKAELLANREIQERLLGI
jgi:branched-chain amino acid transport system ATP-binding protein